MEKSIENNKPMFIHETKHYWQAHCTNIEQINKKDKKEQHEPQPKTEGEL